MKHFLSGLLVLILLQAGFAQQLNIIADSLRSPLGIEVDASGNIWVTETGYGMNDGTVSMRTPGGVLVPVITGLPSFFDTASFEVVGPWRSLFLPNNKLGVLSPLTGGISIYDLNGFMPGVSTPIPAANTVGQIPVSDFVFEQQPADMRDSNPYSAALDAEGNWYVADAAFNAIVRVDKTTGQRSVFARFDKIPNPTPVGPPFIDPVPTRIIARPGGGFYVCTLTGFPFLEGSAGIFALSATGAISVYATGLNTLTDLAVDRNTGDLYALQIGKFTFVPQPGFEPNSAVVTRIKPGGAVKEVVLESFGPAAGLALDGKGNLYISDLFTGRLYRRDNIATGVYEHVYQHTPMVIAPNPAREAAVLQLQVLRGGDGALRVYDMAGQLLVNQELGYIPAGTQQIDCSFADLPKGIYAVVLRVGAGAFAARFSKE